MPRNFGRHVAGEIVAQARSFLDHAKDADIWHSLHDPIRGRMLPHDLKRGEELHQAAVAARAASATKAGATADPTHELDDAISAAESWLHDQLAHARGLLHENGDDKTLDALDKALSKSKAGESVAANVRAYVKLVEGKDATGAALSATYHGTASRDAILKDGVHLAEAVEAKLGAPKGARGDREKTTGAKDDAVDKLARWVRRWALVAHRVVSKEGQKKLGIAGVRHHPAHRVTHPAVAAVPGGGTAAPTP